MLQHITSYYKAPKVGQALGVIAGCRFPGRHIYRLPTKPTDQQADTEIFPGQDAVKLLTSAMQIRKIRASRQTLGIWLLLVPVRMFRV